MKKTLIALTLAALPVAASADVILYGQIKAGVEVAQTKVGDNKSDTTTQIADFGSRIGFKGHEHLGSGLNAIWQVENKVSVAGGGEWAARDSFIGLEGNFGKIRAGKLSTQLNDMGTIDPWEYNNNALGLKTFTRTGERVVSVRYDSPVFAGFSGNVQYTPRDNQSDTGRDTVNLVTGATTTNPNTDTSAYYAGLNYENAGFFAQYGYGYKNGSYVANNTGKSGQAHRIEAGYDANNLFVGLGLQYTDGWDTEKTYLSTLTNGLYTGGSNATGVETKEAAATAAYRFGNVTPRVSYAHGWAAKADGKAVSGKYDQVVLGADYDFSKRTTAMVSAGWLKVGATDNTAKITNTAGLVGVRHKF